MAKFDHERAHMAANLVSDPPVFITSCYKVITLCYTFITSNIVLYVYNIV